MTPSIWSCGGGTQSAAIAALIILGRLPKPDYAVMVDTEREKSATWLYLKHVLRPNLEEAGVNLVVVPKSRYATVDVWGGKDKRSCLLPCFTTQSGELGKLTNYCSGEWKRRVVTRYLKQELRLANWISWLGMSTDEMHRMRMRDENKHENYYPLVQAIPMRRSDCYALCTETMGWPPPPRSACAECPNQSDEEWKDTRDNWPADFERACQFDEEIRLTDPHLFLHHSGKPLREVDFDAQGAFSFNERGCDSGYCFV